MLILSPRTPAHIINLWATRCGHASVCLSMQAWVCLSAFTCMCVLCFCVFVVHPTLQVQRSILCEHEHIC